MRNKKGGQLVQSAQILPHSEPKDDRVPGYHSVEPNYLIPFHLVTPGANRLPSTPDREGNPQVPARESTIWKT